MPTSAAWVISSTGNVEFADGDEALRGFDQRRRRPLLASLHPIGQRVPLDVIALPVVSRYLASSAQTVWLTGSAAAADALCREARTRSLRSATHPGPHQFNRPITCMNAGTSSMRTTVASFRTASDNPTPNIRMNDT